MQGHVKTVDYNGEPLLILFILFDLDDVNKVLKDLNAQVEVLKGFATAWNRGDKDVNGKDPIHKSQPCETLVVMKPYHESTITPQEAKRITVKPASSTLWASTPPLAKGVVHVYSKGNDDTGQEFDSYRIQNSSLVTKYGSTNMQDAISTAMANEYKQID